MIMLPTEKASHIYLSHTNGILAKLAKLPVESASGSNQHIYVLSWGKINKGDWFYSTRLKTVFQAIVNGGYDPNEDFKIVMSTDEDITPDSMVPDAIIGEFIREYYTDLQ